MSRQKLSNEIPIFEWRPPKYATQNRRNTNDIVTWSFKFKSTTNGAQQKLIVTHITHAHNRIYAFLIITRNDYIPVFGVCAFFAVLSLFQFIFRLCECNCCYCFISLYMHWWCIGVFIILLNFISNDSSTFHPFVHTFITWLQRSLFLVMIFCYSYLRLYFNWFHFRFFSLLIPVAKNNGGQQRWRFSLSMANNGTSLAVSTR